jgi:hypothetical protein
MTKDRLWSFISSAALVVVSAFWLWFMFALCRACFQAPNESKAMTVNHFTQQQPTPSTRLC